MSTFEPQQEVCAARPLILLGRHIPHGQRGKILEKWRHGGDFWYYRVAWEPDAAVLTAREDEIMLVDEGKRSEKEFVV